MYLLGLIFAALHVIMNGRVTKMQMVANNWITNAAMIVEFLSDISVEYKLIWYTNKKKKSEN